MNTETTTGSTALIAILGGLTNGQAPSIGRCLYDAGFRALVVPLGSPDPLGTVAALRSALPAGCVVGAAMVATVDQVRRCHEAGARLIVSPNSDAAVIAQTVRLGMEGLPGAATPGEAFAAITAGAGAVSVFPAQQVGTVGLRAWAAVIPKGTGLVPVGGVDASNIRGWREAGATGVGIGSALFTPGIAVAELHRRAVCMTGALELALASTRLPA